MTLLLLLLVDTVFWLLLVDTLVNDVMCVYVTVAIGWLTTWHTGQWCHVCVCRGCYWLTDNFSHWSMMSWVCMSLLLLVNWQLDSLVNDVMCVYSYCCYWLTENLSHWSMMSCVCMSLLLLVNWQLVSLVNDVMCVYVAGAIGWLTTWLTGQWCHVCVCHCCYWLTDNLTHWSMMSCVCIVTEDNILKNIAQMSKALKQLEIDVKNAENDKTTPDNDKFVSVMTISFSGYIKL